LNTTPNPTPADNESEKFRGTLSTGKVKKIKDQKVKGKKKGQNY
jgi:hypothetical protein